jgi:hypothetical protein
VFVLSTRRSSHEQHEQVSQQLSALYFSQIPGGSNPDHTTEELSMVAQHLVFSLGNSVHRAGLTNLLNEAIKKRSLDSGDFKASQVSKERLVVACSCEQTGSCMAHYQVASAVHPRILKAKIEKGSGQLSSFSRWSGIFGVVTTTKIARLSKERRKG